MDTIDIFLSRPTWIPQEFERGLVSFNNFLNTHGLNPRTIGVSDYPSESPLDEVIAVMEQCQGAIILGYPQIRITNGIFRDKKINKELILSTEWNHIETGLAYAKNIPLLLIHHIGIQRGVFERGAVNKFLYEIDMKKHDWALDEKISGAISSISCAVTGFSNVWNRTLKKKVLF